MITSELISFPETKSKLAKTIVVPAELGASTGFGRSMDVVLASLLIIVLSPLFVLISALIVVDSPGLPVYKQKRRGRYGWPFWIYKFRTMHSDAHKLRESMFKRNESDGIIFKMKEDPRITRTGRWLRKFSLDELPQLINVIKGEMSLVGPRPFSIEVFRRMRLTVHDQRKWYVHRHLVRPGMTGLWQVSGRNELSFKDLIRFDLEYVQKRNFLLDFRILLKTIRVVISGKGA